MIREFSSLRGATRDEETRKVSISLTLISAFQIDSPSQRPAQTPTDPLNGRKCNNVLIRCGFQQVGILIRATRAGLSKLQPQRV